ncbi:MAG: YihY family inner membrane protein [Phycisphaerae bacterium]|nr:YihY family inner membrane protein [Phycisphaerae bacterium]
MRVADLRAWIEDFLTRPGEQLGRGARFLRTQIELWRFCGRRLRAHNVAAMSAALSFRTIFALIPTLVLAFLVLRSFGVVEDGKRALRDFLESSGLAQIKAVHKTDGGATVSTDLEPAATVAPETETDNAQPNGLEPSADQPVAELGDGDFINVADQIESVVEEVEGKLTFQRIGPVGALLLIWTAMTLLTTVESSLNRIFEAPTSRALSRRVILFWTAITLGPVLIVATIYISRNAIASAATLPGISWLALTLAWFTPILVGVLVVAAGYRLIPNTHVRPAAAFGGALVAVPAWMVARWAFAIYVERFVFQGNLYGVLGLLPLFLLWLNVSWGILLFGAELAHTATSLSRLRTAEHAERTVLGPSDWLAVAVAIARPYADGRGLVTFEQAVDLANLPGETVQRVLDTLTESDLVFVTNETEPRYGMSRPLNRISLADVVDLADPRGRPDESTNGIHALIANTQQKIRADLTKTTLADLCTAHTNATEPPHVG